MAEIKDFSRLCKANPQKTYMQDFFEKFPDAPVDDDGTPKICPGYVYKTAEYCCIARGVRGRICKDCWNEVMPDAQTKN